MEEKKENNEMDIDMDGLRGKEKEEVNWMIKYNHPYKIKWDLIVMILATYNTIVIPIAVSFEPEELDNSFFFWLDSAVDVMFFIDILINFRYAYIHPKTGEEVWNGRWVACNYLKTRFLIDFLATIPFDTIAKFMFDTNSFIFKFFGILKLIRVLRLSRIITFLELQDDVKTTMKFFKIIFFLFIYLHCLCCLWYYIVKANKDWIPPSNFKNYETDLYTDVWTE